MRLTIRDERAAQRIDDQGTGIGFAEKGGTTPPLCLGARCRIIMSGDEDHGQPTALGLEHSLQFESRHAGELDVHQQAAKGSPHGIAEKGLAAGMNVVRVNQRNCGGTDHLAPTLYNSSLSGDVAAVARHVITHDKITRFVLVGFSMGGNLVLKLLGEWGTQAPAQVKAGIGVSPAMDLAASADALHDRVNRIYEWRFLRGLKKRIERKAALYPGRYDTSYLRRLQSLREFDDRVTARYCGFAGAQDYYTRAASAQVLDRIAVPTLILHAEDDPFIRVLPDTRQKLLQNPHITYLETAHGGHCAFLTEPNGYDGRWAERQAIAFVQRVERGESVAAPDWAGS